MTTWFTSDLHFGHRNILRYEPSRREWLGLSEDATVEDMNEALVELWNSTVKHHDTVMVLGDICMGRLEETLPICRRLNGRIALVAGNHDGVHPAHHAHQRRTPIEWRQFYLDHNVDTLIPDPWVLPRFEFDGVLDGERYLMSHFPCEDPRDDRYPEYLTGFDGVVVHGHVHSEWKVNGRQINVGIDAWHRLLPKGEIEDLIREARSVTTVERPATPHPIAATRPALLGTDDGIEVIR